MLRGKDVNDLINVHKQQHHPGVANLLSWSRISARLTRRVYKTATADVRSYKWIVQLSSTGKDLVRVDSLDSLVFAIWIIET